MASLARDNINMGGLQKIDGWGGSTKYSSTKGGGLGKIPISIRISILIMNEKSLNSRVLKAPLLHLNPKHTP